MGYLISLLDAMNAVRRHVVSAWRKKYYFLDHAKIMQRYNASVPRSLNPRIVRDFMRSALVTVNRASLSTFYLKYRDHGQTVWRPHTETSHPFNGSQAAKFQFVTGENTIVRNREIPQVLKLSFKHILENEIQYECVYSNAVFRSYYYYKIEHGKPFFRQHQNAWGLTGVDTRSTGGLYYRSNEFVQYY